MTENPANLQQYQWKYRLLLIFAPNEDDAHYKQQVEAWQAQQDALLDRDMLVFHVFGAGESWLEQPAESPQSTSTQGALTANQSGQLRAQFSVSEDDFVLVLIGKDGGVKRHETAPTSLVDIFTQVDSMPMRQREMQQGD
ncbi:MAG: DUF4174 domain-containing protein [Deinococcota bacterium]